VHTLASLWGEARAQMMDDDEWLHEAAVAATSCS
jgi:hypothetical protein